MKLPLALLCLTAMVCVPAAASEKATADTADRFENRLADRRIGPGGRELPPYLHSVPFAREISGIQIYGGAESWWDQAASRYRRGSRPRVGAVMAFQPHRNLPHGHVAAVSKVIDRRTVLLSHANWSPVNGRRGQIERNVRAIDVSPDNDWSKVRVWYDPLKAVGATVWPVHGFIYNSPGTARPARAVNQIARSASQAPVAPKQAPAPARPSAQFTQAFAALDTGIKTAPKKAAFARYEK